VKHSATFRVNYPANLIIFFAAAFSAVFLCRIYCHNATNSELRIPECLAIFHRPRLLCFLELICTRVAFCRLPSPWKINLSTCSCIRNFPSFPSARKTTKIKKKQRELHLFASLLAFCRRRLLHISFYCHVRNVSLWHTPPSHSISISMDLGAIYRAFTVVSPTRIEHRRLLTIAGCGQGI